MNRTLGATLHAVVLTVVGVLGVAGYVFDHLRTTMPWRHSVARGDQWEALLADRTPIFVTDTRRDGLLLPTGAAILLSEPEDEDRRIERIDLRCSRVAEDTFVVVRMRVGAEGAYEVRLAPPTSYGVAMVFQPADGREQALAARQDAAFVPPKTTPFDASIEISASRFRVRVAGRPVLDIEDARLADGAVELVARGGPLRVFSFGVGGVGGVGGVADGRAWKFEEDFSSLRPVTVASAVAATLAIPFGVLGFLAIVLAVLVRHWDGETRAQRLSRACGSVATAALPLALLGCALPFVDVEPSLVLVAVLLLLGLGLGLGLGLAIALVARRRDLSRPLSLPERATSRWIQLAIALAAGTFGAIATWTHEGVLLDPWWKEVRVARALPTAKPFELATSTTLDAGNSIQCAGGPFRDFDFGANIRLATHALLEVRLHGKGAEGVALIVSADPRVRTRFVREEADGFTSIGDDSAAIASDRDVHLEIRVRGSRYDATIDGAAAASAEERLFPAGETRLLASREHVAVEAVTLQPWTDQAEAPSITGEQRRATIWFLATVAGFALASSWLLRRGILGGLASGAVALLPFAFVIDGADRHGAARDVAVACTILAGGISILDAASRARGATPLRFHAACAMAIAISVFAWTESRARGWPADPPRLNAMSAIDWSGERIESDLLDFEHPLIRRWNSYLVDHRLHFRVIPERKPAGLTRVIALGTSSTQGYGTADDWPSLLEAELERKPGESRRLEVINAAFMGSNGQRLLGYFENVVLRFEPDVVLLSLYFNDSVGLSQFDESAYYAAIGAAGAERGWFSRVFERFEVTRGVERFRELEASFDSAGAGADASALWRDVAGSIPPPPERFAATLRRFAELSREHGCALILVKEPIAGDGARIWKAEFREAMDRVAREFGLEVADPTPALLGAGGASLFMDEIHPYGTGHRVTAAALAPIVRRVLEKIPR